MVVTDPDAPPHKRASQILVPLDTPGFTGVRPVPVMGHDAGPGHWEVTYEDCRVPADSLLGERGAGFAIAQDRLGPGRIHHCISRSIGGAPSADGARAHLPLVRVPAAEKKFVPTCRQSRWKFLGEHRRLWSFTLMLMDTEGRGAARPYR